MDGDSEGSSKRSRRLSGEPPLHLPDDDAFPPLTRFNPPTKLPTKASAIGRLRHLSGGGKRNMTRAEAVKEVAKEVEDKYHHDTVHCKSMRGIVRELTALFNIYTEGKKRAKAGVATHTKAKQYEQLLKDKDTLFDVTTEDQTRKNKLDLEWGVRMGQREKLYLEDQRGPRELECDSGTDPAWFRFFVVMMMMIMRR